MQVEQISRLQQTPEKDLRSARFLLESVEKQQVAILLQLLLQRHIMTLIIEL